MENELARPRRRAFLRALQANRPNCPVLAAAARRASRRAEAEASTTTTTPSNDNSESFTALKAEIRSKIGSGSPCKLHRLIESVRRGNDVPYARLTNRAVPTKKFRTLDQYVGRVYGGRFIDDSGHEFATSCQDKFIRIYNAQNWTLKLSIPCHDIRWTITDFDVSKCGRWLVYSTLNAYLHLVDLFNNCHQVMLCAIDPTRAAESFGIMTCKFSPNAKFVYVGTGGGYDEQPGTLRVVDVERRTIHSAIPAHSDDVNSVTSLRNDDPNLLLTASDDGFAKVWDLRKYSSPAGTFIGHVEGLTHVHSKNDGRFLITQGKDQCIKLWDTRRASTTKTVPHPPKDLSWDYRYQMYPGRMRSVDYMDDSVSTYRGAHHTLQTLIRCYFSPLHSTGQRYIYTGSGSRNGRFAIYDVLTRKVVVQKRAHRDAVRDVSWHPTLPLLTTVGWDHHVYLWRADPDSPFIDVDDAV